MKRECRFLYCANTPQWRVLEKERETFVCTEDLSELLFGVGGAAGLLGSGQLFVERVAMYNRCRRAEEWPSPRSRNQRPSLHQLLQRHKHLAGQFSFVTSATPLYAVRS